MCLLRCLVNVFFLFFRFDSNVKKVIKGLRKLDSWIKVCNQMSSNSNQHLDERKNCYPMAFCSFLCRWGLQFWIMAQIGSRWVRRFQFQHVWVCKCFPLLRACLGRLKKGFAHVPTQKHPLKMFVACATLTCSFSIMRNYEFDPKRNKKF